MRKILPSLSILMIGLWFCSEPPTRRQDGEAAWQESFGKRLRDYWPTADWREKAPALSGIDKQKLAAFREYAFARTGDEQNRAGIRTDGVVVIRNGYLVFEEYARGYDKLRKHLVWSDTKSVLNAAVGVAVKQGKIATADSAGRYVPQLNSREKMGITVNDLLQMSSGLFWDEGYESSPLKSLVIAMLYTRGRNDMGSFAAEQPVIFKPGERFYYSSGTSNILSLVLKNVIGEQSYARFYWKEIFEPLGMRNVTIERDGSGTFVASSYMYVTPREFAKFGYLYLNDGQWGNKRILPEGWVKYTVTMASSYYSTPMTDRLQKDNPGAHWWLNLGIPETGQAPPWPRAPRDTFAASGHWGQFLFVIPSLDLVVVRTGDDRDGSFDINTFLGLLIDSLSDQRGNP